MPLDPLATTDDLDVRGVDITDTAKVTAMLDAASAAIRDAAGSTISLETSTITIPGSSEEYLLLPGLVRSVTSISVDGTALTTGDYTVVGSQVWRFGGWQSRLTSETSFFLPADRYRPGLVTVTYVHGYTEVPADIVDLCCDLATAGLLGNPSAADPRVTSESVDDYRVGFATGDDAVASVFELPERTKAWLRQRFGSQTYVTGSR